jgi:hypothetical protein
MNDCNNIDVLCASEDTARRAVKDMPDLAVPSVAQRVKCKWSMEIAGSEAACARQWQSSPLQEGRMGEMEV